MGDTAGNCYAELQVWDLGDLAHFSSLELLDGKPIWFTNPAFKNVNGTIMFVLSTFRGVRSCFPFLESMSWHIEPVVPSTPWKVRMKLNKRFLASAALSASVVGTAVAPVAWASDEQVNGAQEFGNGSDSDSGISVTDADNLQPNYELSEDQTSQLGAEELTPVSTELSEKDNAPVPGEEELQQLLPSGAASEVRANDDSSGADSKVVAGDEEQTGSPLMVDTVKAGARKITGSVFLRPGEKKRIQVNFPNGINPTKDLQLDEKSGEEGETPKGKVVTFEFDVPQGLELKANDKIAVLPLYYDSPIDKPVLVTVEPADESSDSQPESSPDSGSSQVPGKGTEEGSVNPPASGKDGGESQEKPQGPSKDAGKESEKPKAPGNGGGEDSVKPPASDKDGGENQKKPQGPGSGADEKPGKPQVPGNGGEKGGSNFGAAFGVIAGVVAFVAGVVKFFNQFSGIARFLQPLRNFFSLFKF